MNYRLTTLHARKAYTSDTTEVIDINIVDSISNLVICLECTHSTYLQTAHPMACLTKIELVDGSDVLYSLDGYEAEALDWYNNGGKFRSNYNWCLNGGSEVRYLGINFGRWLFDPLFALDPRKFTNPQLRISLDIDAGGNAPATIYVTVLANIFDEKAITPGGFLMSKEVKKYTMASAVHEYTDMPTDYPYRAIYFRAYVAGTEPNQCITNIKLSEDHDKKIPFDHNPNYIEDALLNMYPLVEEHYYFALDTSARYLYVAPTTRVVAFGDVWAAAAVAQDAAFYNGDSGRLDCIAAANPSNTQIYVRGAIPHCVYEIPCGIKDDPTDWYNVTRLGSLRADITGAATATGYLFLQQYRNY